MVALLYSALPKTVWCLQFVENEPELIALTLVAVVSLRFSPCVYTATSAHFSLRPINLRSFFLDDDRSLLRAYAVCWTLDRQDQGAALPSKHFVFFSYSPRLPLSLSSHLHRLLASGQTFSHLLL